MRTRLVRARGNEYALRLAKHGFEENRQAAETGREMRKNTGEKATTYCARRRVDGRRPGSQPRGEAFCRVESVPRILEICPTLGYFRLSVILCQI